MSAFDELLSGKRTVVAPSIATHLKRPLAEADVAHADRLGFTRLPRTVPATRNRRLPSPLHHSEVSP